MRKEQAIKVIQSLPDDPWLDIELEIGSYFPDPSTPVDPGDGEESKEVEMIRILGDRVRVLPMPDNNAKEIGYLRKDEVAQAGERRAIGSMKYVQVYIGGFGRFNESLGWLRWVPEKMESFMKEV